jgi:hypothetical protein
VPNACEIRRTLRCCVESDPQQNLTDDFDKEKYENRSAAILTYIASTVVSASKAREEDHLERRVFEKVVMNRIRSSGRRVFRFLGKGTLAHAETK